MTDYRTLLSFSAAVLTNMILFCGAASLMYWVGEKKEGALLKWHDQIQITIGWLFTLYMFLMSHVDGYFAPRFFGQHWTYFNLMIIACFVFNLTLVSWLNWALSALAMLGYMFAMPGSALPIRWWLLAGTVTIAALLTWRGQRIWSKRWVIYPLMILFGAAGIYAMAIGAAPKDNAFWMRQIAALTIEFVFAYEYLAMLVRIRRANDTYRTAASRDRMTDLKNFGTFNTDLERLYRQNQTTGNSFWLLELDIDHFKAINDTYGHLMGNQVLQAVALATRSFAATLPDQTAVYRMGGEEFCLLIYGGANDSHKVATIALELRAHLHDLQFTSDDGRTFRITVSVGAEYAMTDDKHYLDIYNRVDKYLYDAKQAGRDAINVRGATFR